MDSSSLNISINAAASAYAAGDFATTVRISDVAAGKARALGLAEVLARALYWQGDALFQLGELASAVAVLVELVRLPGDAVEPSIQTQGMAMAILAAAHSQPAGLTNKLIEEANARTFSSTIRHLRQSIYFARSYYKAMRGEFGEALSDAQRALRLRGSRARGMEVTITQMTHLLQVAQCCFRVRDLGLLERTYWEAQNASVMIEYDRIFRSGIEILYLRLANPQSNLGRNGINLGREITKFANPREGAEVLDLYIIGVRALIRSEIWSDVTEALDAIPDTVSSNQLKIKVLLLKGDALLSRARTLVYTRVVDDELCDAADSVGRKRVGRDEDTAQKLLFSAATQYDAVRKVAENEDRRLEIQFHQGILSDRIAKVARFKDALARGRPVRSGRSRVRASRINI